MLALVVVDAELAYVLGNCCIFLSDRVRRDALLANSILTLERLPPRIVALSAYYMIQRGFLGVRSLLEEVQHI